MGNKFIDPCPSRRYDDVFKAGLKMMGDIQVPDQATRFRQAALSDPNDERDINPEWLQGKLNEAADVIETMQSELKRRDEQCQHCFQDDAELEAERGEKRILREVLEGIANDKYPDDQEAAQWALANTTAPTEIHHVCGLQGYDPMKGDECKVCRQQSTEADNE